HVGRRVDAFADQHGRQPGLGFPLRDALGNFFFHFIAHLLRNGSTVNQLSRHSLLLFMLIFAQKLYKFSPISSSDIRTYRITPFTFSPSTSSSSTSSTSFQRGEGAAALTRR